MSIFSTPYPAVLAIYVYTNEEPCSISKENFIYYVCTPLNKQCKPFTLMELFLIRKLMSVTYMYTTLINF
jgi:hypothetical protein